MNGVEDDVIGTKPPTPGGLGPLFEQSPEAAPPKARSVVAKPGRVVDALEAHDKKHDVELARVAPLLRTKAFERKTFGVCACDTLRILGVQRTDATRQRAFSWIAVAPRRAGLVSAGLMDHYTPSGNRCTRYVHPDFAPKKEGAA